MCEVHKAVFRLLIEPFFEVSNVQIDVLSEGVQHDVPDELQSTCLIRTNQDFLLLILAITLPFNCLLDDLLGLLFLFFKLLILIIELILILEDPRNSNALN